MSKPVVRPALVVDANDLMWWGFYSRTPLGVGDAVAVVSKNGATWETVVADTDIEPYNPDVYPVGYGFYLGSCKKPFARKGTRRAYRRKPKKGAV